MTRPGSGGHPPTSTTPIWAPTVPDQDLADASSEAAALGDWFAALASQGKATMDDSQEEQLYLEAPDALRRMGIDPTDEAIETWVSQQEHRPHS